MAFGIFTLLIPTLKQTGFSQKYHHTCIGIAVITPYINFVKHNKELFLSKEFGNLLVRI